jgi:hypothetical protein
MCVPRIDAFGEHFINSPSLSLLNALLVKVHWWDSDIIYHREPVTDNTALRSGIGTSRRFYVNTFGIRHPITIVET